MNTLCRRFFSMITLNSRSPSVQFHVVKKTQTTSTALKGHTCDCFNSSYENFYISTEISIENKRRYKSPNENISVNITEWWGSSVSWLSNCLIYVDIGVQKKSWFCAGSLQLHGSGWMYILEAAVKSNHVSKRFFNLFQHPKERVAQPK